MQKTKHSLIIASVMIALTGSLFADHYVAQNGQTPLSPYTSLENAASNIQDAVDAAVAGSTVWVAPGTYYAASAEPADSSVVSIRKSLALRGTTGNPADVIVNGAASYRCLAMIAPNNAKIEVDALTFTNGFYSCTEAYSGGAGVYFHSSYPSSSLWLLNSIITGNKAQKNAAADYIGGGGIYACNAAAQNIISNCLIIGNQTLTGAGGNLVGGGVWVRGSNISLIGCLIAHNQAENNPAGIYARDAVLLDRCTIVSNLGAGTFFRDGPMLHNSLVALNTGAGVNYYSQPMEVFNCTIVNNQSRNTLRAGTIENSIVDQINSIASGIAISGSHNCLPSEPTAGEWVNTLVHGGNLAFIKFVDLENGNFRLQPDSPCVNAGIDQTGLLADSLDLDGLPRIDRFSRKPDIGCYELLPPGMLFRFK